MLGDFAGKIVARPRSVEKCDEQQRRHALGFERGVPQCRERLFSARRLKAREWAGDGAFAGIRR